MVQKRLILEIFFDGEHNEGIFILDNHLFDYILKHAASIGGLRILTGSGNEESNVRNRQAS